MIDIDELVAQARKVGGGYATIEVYAQDVEAMACAIEAQVQVDALVESMCFDFDRLSRAFELRRVAFQPFRSRRAAA